MENGPVSPVSDTGDNKRKTETDAEAITPTKKPKLATPDTESSTPNINKREEQKMEKQKQKELERIEKEKKKEEERLQKEEERRAKKEEEKRQKEHERLKKQEAKELEKELKRKKIEEERLEREQKKEEERLEREQKKEEERLKKQQEKEQREQQRLEKKRKLEEEKERKEVERKRLEDEKRRAEELKERNQMKISSFFQIRKVVSSPQKPKQEELVEDSESAYDRDFLPFFIQNNVIMSPSRQLDEDALNASKLELDDILKAAPITSTTASITLISTPPKPASETISPEDVIAALNSPDSTEGRIVALLEKLPPIKYISFYENSKPPYIGTWCSTQHQKVHFKASNPLDTTMTGFDYDYDSDLEWNKEDEEGEDLDDEDEDEEDVVPMEDDIDDFVENNDGSVVKKFHSLVVINKWNDGTNDDFFSSLTTKPIGVSFPIDPRINYWSDEQTSVPEAKAIVKMEVSATVGAANGETNILVPQKKTIKEPQILAGLIDFIEKNHEFTIGTLVELSKKEFKDYTKAILKNTIQDIAVYNKKTSNWDVKPEMKQEYSK